LAAASRKALLANLYMRRVVYGAEELGLERSLSSCIVTYAYALVILCRKDKAEVVWHGSFETSGTGHGPPYHRFKALTPGCGIAAVSQDT
jgi:hypothetical protein